MARPVAPYLVRLDPADGLQPAAAIRPAEACPEEAVAPAAPDRELAVQAAREDGLAEGLAAARAELDTRLAQEREAFAARLAAERAAWARQEGETLGARIEAAFAAVESNIAASLEKVLRPLILDAVRGKTIDELAEHIGLLLRGAERPVVEIRGPGDLLAKLRERLSALSASIEYVASSSVEVEVVLGQTAIETQLGAWTARLGPLET